MEYEIVFKNILGLESMRPKIDMVKLTTEAKSRSYPNLSNCCSAVLKQHKFCSECDAKIDDLKETQFKQFKLGKTTVPVSAEQLNSIKLNLDTDTIAVSELRDRSEVSDLYYTDDIYACKQVSKHTQEYAELLELLQRTGKVAIGETSIRSRPYVVMIYAYQGTLMVRCLHYLEEVKPIPKVDNVLINEQKVQMLTKLLTINANVNKNPFDIGRFVNLRTEQENILIEKCLRNEPLPVIERVSVQKSTDADEIRRLQELLNQIEAAQ